MIKAEKNESGINVVISGDLDDVVLEFIHIMKSVVKTGDTRLIVAVIQAINGLTEELENE